MTDKQITNSWSKIKPDSAADRRMLDAILCYNRSARSKKEKVSGKIPGWKRLAPAAACLALVIAAAIFGNNAGWFGGKIHTAELSGGTLSFYKSGAPGTGSINFGVETSARDLTPEENGLLFGDIEVTSYGIFSSQDKTLLHVETRRGENGLKLIIAAPGLPTADWVLEGSEETSEINGVAVEAGYFITKENSKGQQNIIYFASFTIDGVPIYAECGGGLEESGVWKSEIAHAVDTLTKNGAPDISAITDTALN